MPLGQARSSADSTVISPDLRRETLADFTGLLIVVKLDVTLSHMDT